MSDLGHPPSNPPVDADARIARLEKRVAREREARRAAERLLESKSLELFTANVALQDLNDSLERRVEERTAEIRAMEAQLRHSQKMEAVGLLAGGIAHDFNNLLMIIGGGAALLPDATGDERETIASELACAVQRGRELTSRLLAFSRREPAEQVSLELSRTVLTLEPLLRRLLTERIALTIDVPDNLVVQLSRGGLDQILFNLAANARDAMPHGGDMHICAAPYIVSADEAATMQLEPGSYVLLEIRDNGLGMSEDTARRAFDPFFSTKPVGAGSGLGLATVYSLVRQSRGHIALHSSEGSGAAFHILLPCAEPLPLADAPADTSSPSHTVGDRILVVDDELGVRRVIASLLHRQGFEVREASSGDEALTWIIQHPDSIDLLISDVRMPGMNGFELALAARAERPQLPVLLISGYVDDDTLHERIDAQGLTMMEKPFDIGTFLDRVRQTLSSEHDVIHPSAA